MMQSTAEKVLSYLRLHSKLKEERKNQYRVIDGSPLRADSDSDGFTLTIHDGEHGAYTDHVTGDSGSLYDLASELGIDTPADGRVNVPESKREYSSLADYARAHYVEPEVFERAGWEFKEVGRKDNRRPALVFPVGTQGQQRVRFLDGKSPRFIWFKNGHDDVYHTWYGLKRAVGKAAQAAGKLPVVICNGEASVVTAQEYGVPAIAHTMAEDASLPEHLLNDLQARWSGDVVIAMDCDEAGRGGAEKLKEQLPDATVIDLGLSEGGDLADFCGLHTNHAVQAIARLVKAEQEKSDKKQRVQAVEFVSSLDMLRGFSDFVEGERAWFGRTIEMPLRSIRTLGGFADIITTKKVMIVGNVSGGGKTIISECLADGFNRRGVNVMYIGDEWSPQEMTARRVQRHDPADRGTVKFTDFLQFANGRIDFDNDTLMRLALAQREIRKAPGMTYYMKTADTAENVVFLEDVLRAARKKIRLLREQGVPIDVIILDYVSLYETYGTANNIEEYKLGIFKSYTKSLDVLGITTSQVKKEAEQRVKEQGGLLTENDLYWLRADKSNLVLTMNRVYQCVGEVTGDWESKRAHKPFLDANGRSKPTPNLIMSTGKNSVGDPSGMSFMHFDWAHMCVREGLHPDWRWDSELHIVRMKAPSMAVL